MDTSSCPPDNFNILLLISHQITSADLFNFPHSFFHFSSSLWRHKGRIVLGLCYAFSSPHRQAATLSFGQSKGGRKNESVPLECVANVWKERKKSSALLSKTTSKDTLNIISNIWQIFCSVIACDYGYKSRKAVLNSTLSMHTNFTYYLVQ